MSSFDHDELQYKAKYLKYKNKYINLKEQYGGVAYDNTMIVLLYEASALPELVALKDEYLKNVTTRDPDVTVDGKKMSISAYQDKDFSLPLEAINGLPNIYQYKTEKEKFNDFITPIITYNFDSQNKLLDCTKNSGYNLASLGFKSKEGLNLKELTNLVTRYNTDKQHIVSLNEEKDKLNPINDFNLTDRGNSLLKIVNEHTSSKKERENTYSTIVTDYLKKFTNTFNESLQSKKMNKGFTMSDEGGKISIKLNDVNSLIVVKNWKYDANKKLFTFKIVNPGFSGSSEKVEEPPAE
jgi:hypothetical protein